MTNYLAGGPAGESHQNIVIHRYQMICYPASGSPDDLRSGRWSGRDKSSGSHQNIIIHHYQMTCYPDGVRLVRQVSAWESHQEVIRKSSGSHQNIIIHHYQMTCNPVCGSPDDLLS